MVQGLRAVKAYDERTVVYFQREPFVTNHLQLVWPILPKHAFEKALAEDPTLETSSLNREPVTCGPYRLTLWRANQELVFERRDDWFLDASGKQIRRKPFFRQVRFRVIPQSAPRFLAFLAGDTDDTQLDSAQWEEDSTGQGFLDRGVKVRGDEWTYVYVGWNVRSVPPNPFFGDRRVRWAMSLALDHEFILEKMFFGIYRPGVGIFHPDSWMAAKGLEPVRKDLGRAEELLDEAGWKDSDGDGIRDKAIDGKVVPFRFRLSCPNAGSGPRVVEQFEDDLRLVGVDCRANLIEWNAFQEALQNRELEAFAMAMGAGVDPDTARNLWTTKAIEEGRNQVGFSDPKVDALLEEGRREHDPQKRAAIYAQVDRIIYEDQPVSILLYQPTLWAFSKSFRGYHPSPKGFYGFAPGFFSIWKAK
jgi:peptide/nickel transport system substrate-binding protein